MIAGELRELIEIWHLDKLKNELGEEVEVWTVRENKGKGYFQFRPKRIKQP